ncbi:MAG: AsmA-like C-terminal region-containing protein, partial [Gammaproteobacteria bacterium]
MDFALIASVNGLPLDIAGNTGSLVQLSNNEQYHLNFKGEFNSADFMLTGRFERPLDLEGFSARVDLGVDSLSQFRRLTNYPLPEYGPLQISANISEKGGVLFVNDLRGTLADMNINATGKIKYPNKLKGMDFKLKVKAKSLSDLSRVIQYNNFPRVGPLSLSARVTDGKNVIKFSGLDMKLDKSDLKGNVEIYLRKKKPYIAASLDSSLLDLSPFMPKKSSKNVIGGKVFSSSTLPFASLNKIDADLNINAYRIKTRRDNFDKVYLNLALKNGRLSSKKLKATLAGGSIDGKLNIDASRPGKTWVNGLINVYGLQPSRLSNLHNDISGAPTDMNIRVNGTGKSIAEIMGNMNGKIFVKVGKGTIKSDKFTILDSEIISNAVNTLLPLPPDKPGRELICAVMNLEIKDGQAATNKGIALSTERMDVVGSGLVNLKDETLNIGVKPRGKNGFGVGAGSLADLVRIVGPLSNPHIQPDGVAAF